ncbi:MAG TPA: response regulator [Arenibaculum sp.]|nr:response regulator [Arenibaculum sp.]
MDDDDLLLDYASIALTRAGHRVEVTRDAAEGLRLLDESDVDLLVTDIFMPMHDGLELLRQTRTLHPRLPILAMSGGGERVMIDYLAVARSFGASGTLRKPFTPSLLTGKVASLLQTGAGAA